MLFGATLGLTSYFLFDIWWLSILLSITSFLALETGHGTFYEMNGYNDHNNETGKPRIQKLEYIVRFFYYGDITKPFYSWCCMGLKGLLIALPLGFMGLLNAVLWPLSYYIGFKKLGKASIAEGISGFVVGSLCLLALFLA